MQLSRRKTLALGLGGAAVALGAAPAVATAAEATIERFTNGTPREPGGLALGVPEIAENGNAVPVEIVAPGAVAVLLVAPANPVPEVLTVRFPDPDGPNRLSTRIRMADTQTLVAVAEMADGRFVEATARVHVTVGGCGA